MTVFRTATLRTFFFAFHAGAKELIWVKPISLDLLGNASKLNRTISDSAFVSTGFSSWKKPVINFGFKNHLVFTIKLCVP